MTERGYHETYTCSCSDHIVFSPRVHHAAKEAAQSFSQMVMPGQNRQGVRAVLRLEKSLSEQKRFLTLQMYADEIGYSKARLWEICKRYAVDPRVKGNRRGITSIFERSVLDAMMDKHRNDVVRRAGGRDKGNASQLNPRRT